MNLYLVIPILTGVALFQSVVLSQVDLWGARPDVMLLAVLVWAVVRGLDEGMVWGFVGGVIVDLGDHLARLRWRCWPWQGWLVISPGAKVLVHRRYVCCWWHL